MPPVPVANQNVIHTGTPPIPEARGWLNAYDGRYGPALNLSQAAPGSPPPPEMLAALGQAAADPAMSTYGPILGEDALRTVYARHTGDVYGTIVSPDEIAITTGCNQAFIIAVLAVAKAGDAILLPEPWYFNHQMTLQILGFRLVPLPCRADKGFAPDVGEARDLMRREKCRAIVLVTPNNPTGAIYAPSLLRAFGELAVESDAWLIVDETYRDFLDTRGARPHDMLADQPLAVHLIQLYSFSKSYAMPGHRIGALRAPEALMPEIVEFLDCLQICAPRIGQAALAGAIETLSAWREANRADIVARARAFERALASSNGWRIRSIGAYFAYVEHPLRDTSAPLVAKQLAERAGVLALPGTFFGGASQDRYLRFAFANVGAQSLTGIDRRLALVR